MADYIIVNGTLYHHGIKGQKWGVRRFQNEDGSYTLEGRKRYGIGDSFKKPKLETSLKETKSNSHYSKDAQYYKDKGDKVIRKAKISGVAVTALGVAMLVGTGVLVTKGEDSVAELLPDLAAIGLATTALGVGYYSTGKNYQKGREHIKEEAEKSEFKSLDDIPKASINYSRASAEKLMDNVNPYYPNPGSTANCMLCTSAMIMRLKGYDVKANKSNLGHEPFEVEDWFDNCEIKRFEKSTKDGLVKELSSQGNGSYGNLMIQWSTGGGHSILYTVKNDKVKFIDGQSGREYSINEIAPYVDFSESCYCQMNNSVPTELARGLILRND